MAAGRNAPAGRLLVELVGDLEDLRQQARIVVNRVADPLVTHQQPTGGKGTGDAAGQCQFVVIGLPERLQFGGPARQRGIGRPVAGEVLPRLDGMVNRSVDRPGAFVVTIGRAPFVDVGVGIEKLRSEIR